MTIVAGKMKLKRNN